jgi:REP element-mobilizing transposase RayT
MEPSHTNLRPLSQRDTTSLRALAYFLTFRTYGTWLHGDERGSVNLERHSFGTPRLPAQSRWLMESRQRMQQPPLLLSDEQRAVCSDAMIETCSYRGWTLRAINVRTNHVHVVVSAAVLPERVMVDLKAYSTRALRRALLVDATRRVWSQHGSTRMLYSSESVERACRYTIERQGARLGVAPAES